LAKCPRLVSNPVILWDYTYVPKKGDTAARLVTVPFSKLIKNAKYADSPNTSPVFKPEALIEVALCIGGRNDEPGDRHITG
jgi:hypothetical protein